MQRWEQINFEQRKIISSCLSKGFKLVEIATLIDVGATSISREIKRNRSLVNASNSCSKCPKIERYPYVCNGCKLRYTACLLTRYKYDAKEADSKAKTRLVQSRVGLDIDEEDFLRVNEIVKDGVNSKQSIYHIHKSNEDFPSTSTLYRWINEGKMSIKPIELPCAVKYKKRKSKVYKYDNSDVDRTNRSYLDFLNYRLLFPGNLSCQMDFLGKIRSDNKVILTLTIVELHFVYLKILAKQEKEKVIDLFNELEMKLGIKQFKRLFPTILTDRDPCFIDYLSIEYSPFNGEERTKVFYCDPYNSSQKGNVENMNKQLRKYFPKGRSIDKYTQKEVTTINKIIIEQKIPSLSGKSPLEAFIKIFGEETLKILFS